MRVKMVVAISVLVILIVGYVSADSFSKNIDLESGNIPDWITMINGTLNNGKLKIHSMTSDDYQSQNVNGTYMSPTNDIDGNVTEISFNTILQVDLTYLNDYEVGYGNSTYNSLSYFVILQKGEDHYVKAEVRIKPSETNTVGIKFNYSMYVFWDDYQSELVGYFESALLDREIHITITTTEENDSIETVVSFSFALQNGGTTGRSYMSHTATWEGVSNLDGAIYSIKSVCRHPEIGIGGGTVNYVEYTYNVTFLQFSGSYINQSGGDSSNGGGNGDGTGDSNQIPESLKGYWVYLIAVAVTTGIGLVYYMYRRKVMSNEY